MNLVVFESEAYNQLQKASFDYIRSLMEQEHTKPTFGWVDNKEAAKLLGVGLRTMQNWRDKGLLKFSSFGGKVYYHLDEIDRALQLHSHKAFRAVA